MSDMVMALRHSHIAIRTKIEALAHAVKTDISSGEDDFGPYRFFDLVITHKNGDSQRVRFAAHTGDRMVHLLAEKIGWVSDLAAALYAVGASDKEALSISTNHQGVPLRSLAELCERIAAMSAKSASEAEKLTIRPSHRGPRHTPTKIALH